MVRVSPTAGKPLGLRRPPVWRWHSLWCLWSSGSCQALPLVPGGAAGTGPAKTSPAWARLPPTGPRCSLHHGPLAVEQSPPSRVGSAQSSLAHFCPAGPERGVGASKCSWNRYTRNRIESNKCLSMGLCFLHFSDVDGSWREWGRRWKHRHRALPRREDAPWPLSAPVVPQRARAHLSTRPGCPASVLDVCRWSRCTEVTTKRFCA